MPASELAAFETNLQRALDLSATAGSLRNMVTPAVDLSDLYRAAYMQGVSAFDHFIHEEVRVRMLEWHGRPQSTWPAGFATFKIPISSTHQAGRSVPDAAVRFEAEIRSQHGHLSFQHPDKVAAACRLVSNTEIWQTIATALGTKKQGKLSPSQVAKKDWGLIIDRRNLIVHEADLDPTPPRSRRYPIDKEMTDEALQKIGLVTRLIAASL
ncbi:hypothetical protein PlfCFBP13513_14795 [Plantibacter flavus]|nr:hypothetical protein PlfCFBP13513_14795 [Plantibacter flavus]